jgi:hypothetical protein
MASKPKLMSLRRRRRLLMPGTLKQLKDSDVGSEKSGIPHSGNSGTPGDSRKG